MVYYLENEYLKVAVEGFGAELTSILAKDTQQEYLWEADPAYWGKTSPILFPFIGKLEGESFRHKGKEYVAEKHGFARDMDFTLAVSEKDRLVLMLESTEETLEKFPFPFRLEITYLLTGKSLELKWCVHNTGSETMYFSMGGHPAFACPLKKNGVAKGTRSDAFIRLYGAEDKKAVSSQEVGAAIGLLNGKSYEVAVDNGVFPITRDMFAVDALILADEGIYAVGILNEKKEEYIRMDADCPVWGIWSKPQEEASYICLEPWWGICDSQGYQGDLEQRPYTNLALPGGVCESGFTIHIKA